MRLGFSKIPSKLIQVHKCTTIQRFKPQGETFQKRYSNSKRVKWFLSYEKKSIPRLKSKLQKMALFFPTLFQSYCFILKSIFLSNLMSVKYLHEFVATFHELKHSLSQFQNHQYARNTIPNFTIQRNLRQVNYTKTTSKRLLISRKIAQKAVCYD